MVLSKFASGDDIASRMERCLERLESLREAQVSAKGAADKTLQCYIAILSAMIDACKDLLWEGTPESVIRSSLMLSSFLSVELTVANLTTEAKTSAMEGAMGLSQKLISDTAQGVDVEDISVK